jgi:hypothetical protein
MPINKIDPKVIKPALNVKNWKVISQDKVEIINGDVHTHMPKSHWFYPMIAINKQFIATGFYKDTTYLNELVRVGGSAPDLWVITFQKKGESEIGRFGAKRRVTRGRK